MEQITNCPWCGSDDNVEWSEDSIECECGVIFVKERHTKEEAVEYYKEYNDFHQADGLLNGQRDKMYKLEYDLIQPYLKKGMKVLDVGCGQGGFLDLFEDYECIGIEIGEEAAKIAGKKHNVFFGDFTTTKLPQVDLIIFRGVIEHILHPKKYLDKAVSLLNRDGLIYITSTPNSESVCCTVFADMWNQHKPDEHLVHFAPRHFDKYFLENRFSKVKKKFFYEETPYIKDSDHRKVLRAIEYKLIGREIDYISPAFYGSMMSLIYRKD